LIRYLKSFFHVESFADDANVFHNIVNMDDCVVLQTALFKLINWCERVGLSLNLDKCKTMTLFRTRKSIIHDYQVYNQTLSQVYQVDDLGFGLIGTIVVFNNHIEYVTCKALRTLGFIRRNASDFDQLLGF